MLAVTVEVENSAAAAFAGRVRFETDCRAAEAEVRVLPEARTWSVESPALYDARAV